MNETVVHQTSPVFPEPLVPDPDAEHSGTIVSGTTRSSIRRVHGRCADFCANDDVPTHDATVAEHGTKCESFHGLVVTGLTDELGNNLSLFGSLVAPYTHGIYNSWQWATLEHRGYVALSDEVLTEAGWVETRKYMTASQARTIAAGLVYLADQLEQPTESLCTERQRREAEESRGQEGRS